MNSSADSGLSPLREAERALTAARSKLPPRITRPEEPDESLTGSQPRTRTCSCGSAGLILWCFHSRSRRRLVPIERPMNPTLSSLLAISFIAPMPEAFQRADVAPHSGGRLHVVDDDGGPGVAFTDLQPAVDAASDGDLILVRSGTYSAFQIDGKALIVHAQSGAEVLVKSIPVIPADVRNLRADQHVVLRGIDLNGGTLAGSPTTRTYTGGFASTDNVGSVWVEDCQILGTAGGANVLNSSSVVFLRCGMRGEDLGGDITLLGLPGGSGLVCESSQVHLYGSSLQGGEGSSFEGLSAFDGGHGAHVEDGFLFASDCSFTGGRGGNSVVECGEAGDGLLLAAGSPTAWTLGSTFQGGSAVTGLFCTGPAGAEVVVQSGTHNTIGRTPLSLTTSSPEGEGAPVALTVEGPPGALVFLAIGRTPISVFRATLNGSVLVAPPRRLLLLGQLPASGALDTQALFDPLVGLDGYRLQAAYVMDGEIVLGGASTIVGLRRDELAALWTGVPSRLYGGTLRNQTMQFVPRRRISSSPESPP